MTAKDRFRLRLRELREAAGLTQKQLAEKTGLSQGAISGLEQGANGPTLENAQTLAAALGVEVTAFSEDPASTAPRKPGRPRKSDPSAADIPVAGVVSAGPGSMEERDGETINVAIWFRDCVAYQVRGDSMSEANIKDGDYVVVRKSPAASDGDIVVVWHNDTGGQVKRLTGGGKYLMSQSGGRSRHPLTSDHVLLGVLVGVIRKM